MEEGEAPELIPLASTVSMGPLEQLLVRHTRLLPINIQAIALLLLLVPYTCLPTATATQAM